MIAKLLKKTVLFLALGLIILTSCQEQNTADKAKNQRAQIEEMEQHLFEIREQTLDLVLADSMILLYKKYAIEYPNDSASVDYLFKSAEVEMGINKNQDCLNTLTLIQNSYPDNEIIPTVLHFKAFVYDDKFQEFDKARACLDELINNYPEDRLIENAIGYRNMIGKDPQELFRKADSTQAVAQ